tara:strand:+ start:459 stop:2075 length:1617 start_codon:yes stop_codon:yes gene_type:complete
MNKWKVFIPVLLAIAMIMGFVLGTNLNSGDVIVSGNSPLKALRSRSGETQKLDQIIEYIDQEYVDSVQRKELVDKSIQFILQELDPHSYYITAEELAEMNEPLEGNFEGIGVQFNIQKDTVVVVTPLVGGPSEKVGIKAGDRIIAVNEEVIAGNGIRNSDVLRLLKGEKGTKVNVQIKRASNDSLKFTIVRDKIPIHSVEVAYMVDDVTGYIKVSRFAKTTFDEFTQASEKLLNKGMKKLIVDLRGNGGGFLDAAVSIADEFLSAGELIVYTEGRSRPREDFKASGNNLLVGTDVAVLVDEASASASEILAGAIQDNDRGYIVGRRTFGKGLVQEQTMWPDGSATRLTIARYYTPTGRCIQKPYTNGTESYNEEMYDRYEHGEMFSKDSVQINDSLKYTTPGGKIVYGGGGIVPDYFIPYDTSGSSTYYNHIIYNGLIYEWAWNYADKHRDELKALGSYKAFDDNFNISESIFEDFVDYASNNGVARNKSGIENSKTNIKRRLKSYIARNIWNNDGFYPIWNQGDQVISRALEVLETK